MSIISFENLIIFELTSDKFKPYDSEDKELEIEIITNESVDDVAERFGEARIPVFKEKLAQQETGIFLKKKGAVTGFSFRKDYELLKKSKIKKVIPLSGKFSITNFSRVAEEYRGQGLFKHIITWLVRDAFEKGIPRMIGDIDANNIGSIKGVRSLGYYELFRVLVIQLQTGHKISFKYHSK